MHPVTETVRRDSTCREMPSTSFTFQLKNQPSVKRVGSNKPPALGGHLLPKIFEAGTETCSSEIRVKSTVTSLSSAGFIESIQQDYRQQEKVIDCKNRLPPIQRRKERNSYGPSKELGQTTKELVIKQNSIDKANQSDKNASVSPSVELKNVDYTSLSHTGENSESDDSLCPDFEQAKQWREENRKMLEKLGKQQSHMETGSSALESTRLPILLRHNRLSSIRQKNLNSEDTLTLELNILPEFSFESYETVPVEEFGLATLRGMGYDSKKHHSSPPKIKFRVYPHAGLGAEKEFEIKNK